MPELIDFDKLITDIKSAVEGVIKMDFSTLGEFQDRQVRTMAQQAADIAEFSIKGQIDNEQRDFFLDDLARTAKTFAKTVAALVAIAIERIWNAVVGAIWDAINGAIDTAIGALPLPSFPSDS